MRQVCFCSMIVLLAGAAVPTFAQGDAPPVIEDVTLEIIRLTGLGYAAAVPFTLANFPADYGDLACEGDILIITVAFSDEDLVEWEEGQDPGDPPVANRGDEEFYSRKQSLWLWDSDPDPGPVPGDTWGFNAPPSLIIDPLPAATGTFIYIVTIPEWTGPNQARLRDPVNHPYDVGWWVTIELSNEEAPSEDTPVARTTFPLFAVENPVLRPGNPPAFADAGSDQVVAVGSAVTLDARQTYDATNVGFDPLDPDVFEKDSLAYVWEWISGPQRVDPTPNVIDPALAAVTLTELGEYIFRVLVTDGVNADLSTDTISITVVNAGDLPENNLAPRAAIVGPAGPVTVGSVITLDGNGSSDPDGDTLSHRWRQTNELGSDLTFEELTSAFQPLSGLTQVTSTWEAITTGTFYFRLLVTDPFGATASILIAVEVVEASGAAGILEQGDSTYSADRQSADEQTPLAPACGGGLMPLAMVPLVLWLGRGRIR